MLVSLVLRSIVAVRAILSSPKINFEFLILDFELKTKPSKFKISLYAV